MLILLYHTPMHHSTAVNALEKNTETDTRAAHV
jgi:hypothetical protein